MDEPHPSAHRGPTASCRWWWVPLALVAAIAAAYANSLHAPFLFDDEASIERNPAIRRLWPLTDAMSSTTPTLTGRPLASLSLALNHAAGGLQVEGYHVVNVSLHALNALLVWGILRRVGGMAEWRSGRRERWNDAGAPPGDPASQSSNLPTFQPSSSAVAAAIALLWALHPLATECVTYVVQRTELLGSGFVLLTFYAYLRSLDAANPRTWQAVAVAACLLGVGSKEVAAVAPVLVWVYDRQYAGADRLGLWGGRGWLYAGLLASWVVLAVLLATTGFGWKTSLDQVALGPWGYAKTQATVIVHYLRLCFWPAPLVLDYYGWPLAPPLVAVLPQSLLVLALLAASCVAVVRRQILGFWGVWFFLLLAPTSSFLPLPSEPAAERRLYLPLLAVLVVSASLVTWTVRSLVRRGLAPGRAARATIVLVLLLAATELVLTVRRNQQYQSAIGIWQATVRDWPHSFRAFNNLGVSLLRAGRLAEAGPALRAAARLSVGEPTILCNVAELAARQGDTNQAVVVLATAIRSHPDHADAHRRLAVFRLAQGANAEAMRHFQWALEIDPQDAATHIGLARLWESAGEPSRALDHYRQAMRLDPRDAVAYYNAGNLLAAGGRLAEAEPLYRAALRRRPDDPRIHTNLGNLLGQLGRPAAAIESYREAVRLDPDLFEAQNNLAVVLAGQGRLAEAIPHLRRAIRLRPNLTELQAQLAEWEAAASRSRGVPVTPSR